MAEGGSDPGRVSRRVLVAGAILQRQPGWGMGRCLTSLSRAMAAIHFRVAEGTLSVASESAVVGEKQQPGVALGGAASGAVLLG